MKSETKTFFSFMKTWPFWILIGAFCFTSFFIYQNRKVIERDRSKEMLSCSDSLANALKENAALRLALSEKLISYCDTITVDQKLAQQKLDEYSYRMYEIKEAQEMKAYDQKESADLGAFDVYQKTQAKFLIEFEKKDPKVFLDYAIISFRADKHNGSYNADRKVSLKKEEIEKIPVVANFVNADKNAWDLRMEAGKKLEEAYDKRKKEIQENYNQKIADKKIELGL